jgi:hypothetical protein
MNASVHKTCGSIASTAGHAARLNPAGETISLRRHQHMNVAGAAGWTITALSGSAWITQDGDIRDVVLEAGQSFVLDRDGPVIISPFGDTCLRICGSGAAKARRPADVRRLFSAPARVSFA